MIPDQTPMQSQMSYAQLVILHLGAIVSALLAAGVAIWTRKSIQNIHVSINSRVDQLLQSIGESSHAAGVAEGRAAADARTDKLAEEKKP